MGKQVERVGLLFVHGVGEQKRFEHLRNSVRQLAELIRCSDLRVQVSIVDRTAEWPHPPGHPPIEGSAPITLMVVDEKGRRDFECHEVWWADLGKRSSFSETISFWLWGLGQWGAPFYRRLDITRTSKGKPHPDDLAIVPDAFSGRAKGERATRWLLLWAATVAVLTVFSWSLIKAIGRRFTGSLPSPSLVVQFLGDVQTYEERARPNRTTLSDPGHPPRVGIRRRMVAEMVAMAGRDYEGGWYVLAHSLGTVLAYNGLTELGHTLPNYLPQRLWNDLPERFKHGVGVRTRPHDDLSHMVPGRPGWLAAEDVINRPTLFAGLRAFVTYGSPLDKFAAIWPRIVATANDREGEVRNPFPKEARWLNIAAPHDPVAGALDAYGATVDIDYATNNVARVLPPVVNWTTARGWDAGFVHNRYFDSWERFARPSTAAQREQLIGWLFGRDQALAESAQTALHPGVPPRFLYAGVTTTLFAIACVVSWAGLNLLAEAGDLFTEVRNVSLYSTCLLVISLVASLISCAGLARWKRESDLNLSVALHDFIKLSRDQDWDWHSQIVFLARRMATASRLAAGALIPAIIGAFVLGVALLFENDAGHVWALWVATVGAVLGVTAAIYMQASMNAASGAGGGGQSRHEPPSALAVNFESLFRRRVTEQLLSARRWEYLAWAAGLALIYVVLIPVPSPDRLWLLIGPPVALVAAGIFLFMWETRRRNEHRRSLNEEVPALVEALLAPEAA